MVNKSVTQRYPSDELIDSQVTRCYQPEPIQITKRYISASTSANKNTSKSHALIPDSLIADRYLIQSEPLGAFSGEADVYQCLDTFDNRIVAVKLYRYSAIPKVDVISILQQLDHPNVVTLYEHGEWQGRFYEVMEFCAGGVMSDYMPFSEEEIREVLPRIIQALEHCHRQGIVHRDIKPNNLFFNNAKQRQPLIGDFGISSYLEANAEIRCTQTAANLTLDYAAPELLDGHKVSAKTDYYSLGITLLHLLYGRSPFYGLNQNDILVSHLRGRVSLPNDLSLEFHQLLRGLTLPNPEDRWGYNEVLAWLQGENVALRLDSLQHADPEQGVKPYPGYPQARTLQALALSLDKFDAFKQLQRGDIRRWVFDNVNQNLAEEIEALETGYGDRSELALYKLKGLLAPELCPLKIGQQTVKTLRELLELSKQTETDHVVAQHLLDALWNEYLESWIISSKPAGKRNPELLEKIISLRERLHYKAPDAALFALRYILAPQMPVQINDRLQLTSPLSLKENFDKAKEVVEDFLIEFIYSKRFDEWLRAAEFSNWEKDLQFIEKARHFYLDNKKIGTYCVLWHYYPELPFSFEGQQIQDPVKLATLIDESPENTQKGIEILENGWLRAWLIGSGKLTTITEFDQCLLNVNDSIETKLEAVLHLLNPQLAFPKLHSSLTEFYFGRIFQGDSKTMTWVLSNEGRGYLTGEILLEYYGEGVFLDKYVIEGNRQVYEVTVKVMNVLTVGKHQNALHIRSNGGNLKIPIYFTVVEKPEESEPWWQLLLDRFF